MRKKLLLIFLIPFFSYGQNCNYDSIIQKVVSKNFTDWRDSLFCKQFISEACAKVSHDSLCIPTFDMNLSTTFIELLERDYKILYEKPTHGMIFGGLRCWDEVMTQAIESKYKKGVLEKIRLLADSLDKKGIGFIEPKYLKGDIEEWLKQQLKIYRITHKGKGLLLILHIDKNGKILEAELYPIYDYEYSISKYDENIFLQNQELNNIILNMDGWQAAKLRGEPVESIESRIINGL